MSVPPSEPLRAHASDESEWYSRELEPLAGGLRSFLRRRYPQLTEVDDVVQVSLLRTFREWQNGTLRSARAFLYASARNLAVDFFRERKVRGGDRINEAVPLHVLEDDADTVESVCTQDERAAVAAAIAELPARRRQVIALRLLQGVGHPEIASRLGIAPETVRVTIKEGMQQITKILKERGIIANRTP